MNKEDEAKIREIIKTAIDKAINKERGDTKNDISKAVKDSEKSQKEQMLSILGKEIDSLDKKIFTKKQIKDLMIAAFSKQHKFMWEKTKFLTTYFNDL